MTRFRNAAWVGPCIQAFNYTPLCYQPSCIFWRKPISDRSALVLLEFQTFHKINKRCISWRQYGDLEHIMIHTWTVILQLAAFQQPNNIIKNLKKNVTLESLDGRPLLPPHPSGEFFVRQAIVSPPSWWAASGFGASIWIMNPPLLNMAIFADLIPHF